MAKTKTTEKKLENPYLAGRYILWKNIVFSVFSVFFWFSLVKKRKKPKKLKKPYLAGRYILWKNIVFSVFSVFSVFFSVFPIVLVLATRCIPLAKFGWMFAVKQMMANLMQGTCRGGVSAERRIMKKTCIYIYIYGTPCAHEKGRLSRGGVPYIYIYVWSPFKIGLKIQGPKKVAKHRKYC